MAPSLTTAPLFLLALAAYPLPAPAQDLVLRSGRYLDIATGAYKQLGAILIHAGRITEIRPPGSEGTWDPATTTIDLAGRTLLPGLIDAHVHLTIAGEPAANAAATLRAGFTTVVDMGSAGGQGIHLRDDIAAGKVLGPTMIAAGSWIGAKGGVCEFGGATVSSPEEAAARARQDISAGADAIKVCVTGWPADAVAAPDSVELGQRTLAAVMEAAGTRPVYAHAIGRAGALLAASLGARALVHTPIMSAGGVATLKSSGVYLIPTLTAGADSTAVRDSFIRLHQAGLRLVFGTDAGVLTHGQNAKEFATLATAGLTPLEALRSATLATAQMLGRTDLGVIAPGAVADFVVVGGDPLADITLLERPAMVIHLGRVVD